MKNIILLLLLLLGSLSAQAQDINWLSLDEALQKQKRQPKPIFMDVFTEWCGPCKIMDRTTFQDPEVVEYINRNFYAVKFNAEGNAKINYMGYSFSNPNFDPDRRGRNSAHELTKYLKVPSYPVMYILDTKGNVKEIIEGPKEASDLLRVLKS